MTLVNGLSVTILGAAAVALAGILSSLRVTNTRLEDNTYLFFGAGAVSLSQIKGLKFIYLFDGWLVCA